MDTKALRQKILDLAIHGHLLPQDPNDEPAETMLRRLNPTAEIITDNVPFEIPNSWVWTKLGDICNYGKSTNVSIDNIDDKDWVLELEDIEKDSARIIQHLSKKDRQINGVRHKFTNGDILYSKLRTYLNKVLIAPQDGYCTTEIIPFKAYGNISNEFICHVLRSQFFLDYTAQCGYGVKMPRLSTTDACKGFFPLPPLAEQERIVKEIERWFDLIDIIEKNKTNLKQTIKQTKNKILDLAIHGHLLPQDPNDEPAIELLKRIRKEKEHLIKEGTIKKTKQSPTTDTPQYDNIPFEIPNTWEFVKMSELFLLNPKNNLQDNLDIGFVPMTNVEDGFSGKHSFEIKKWKDVKKGYSHFQNGDIGIAKISPCFENLKSCIFNSLPNDMGAGTTELVILRDMGIFTPFYLYLFKSSWYITQGTKYFKGVVGQQRVNKEIFTELYIPLPPLAEQERIVGEIEKIFAVLDRIEKEV